MSNARHHAEWLSLLEVSGPFLSLPVLLRVFPNELEARNTEQAQELKLAYADWSELGERDSSVHRLWVRYVLERLLGFTPDLLAEGASIPPGMEAKMAEYGETLRPDHAVVYRAAGAEKPEIALLIQVYPPSQRLDSPVKDRGWKASPDTRMAELLHGAGVPLGLVTNGERWMLVHAPRGETTGFASWYADLWMQEPLLLRSFCSLLNRQRLIGVAAGDRLVALLSESAKDQQEVTDQLGYQVRKAVEVFVNALDRIDQDTNRELLKDVPEKAIYDGALTVMMRLVFLFKAEELGLLLLGDEVYDENYAVSTLRDQLRERADQHGEEILERRSDAWCRLLATFRAVYAGTEHDTMRLPPYGGTLLDPDRYPFLEGRKSNTSWREAPAKPLPINNRVVLHLLEALQILRVKVPGGGPAEPRRLSFRSLDIEQIGHIYEGLLDHTARRANQVLLGIASNRDSEQEIPLAEIEQLSSAGGDKLSEFLGERTGRSKKALEKALVAEDLADDSRLMLSVGGDKKLGDRLRPFIGLLREDSFGQWVVIKPGEIFVTSGSDRRSTGTHYTPRSLTEPIVQHTLEPLVYVGPAEGKPKAEWVLKSPKKILALKVCDMAMGSGAFLVQSCRYLAERLVEAWEKIEKANAGQVIITPEGELSAGSPAERLLPVDQAERITIARRFVADRCLYGVDINPMAVEMAKLSLWLITLQRDRPFTFLDHALKCGDSLIGVSSLNNIEMFSLHPSGRQVTFATANLSRLVQEASEKRHTLESLPSNEHSQIEAKNHLHAEAEKATLTVRALADALILFELRGLKGEEYEEQRAEEAEKVRSIMERDAEETKQDKRPTLGELTTYAREKLHGRRPFHWAIEFPEVFQNGGFDAMIGNPPFIGFKYWQERLPQGFGDWVQTMLGQKPGKSDLVAVFLRRAFELLRQNGNAGMLATTTAREGVTLEFGLAHIFRNGSIYRALSSMAWPGAAGVHICIVWFRKAKGGLLPILDGKQVSEIGPSLVEASHFIPKTLQNAPWGFTGCDNGKGEALILQKGDSWLERLLRVKSPFLRQYLTGDDIATGAYAEPQRWVLDCSEYSLTEVQRSCPTAAEFLRTVVQPVRTREALESHPGLFERWWQFSRTRAEYFSRLRRNDSCLAIPVVAKFVSVVEMPTAITYTNKVCLLERPTADKHVTLLSSVFEAWIIKHGGTMGASTITLSVSKCVQTFAFPKDSPAGAVGMLAGWNEIIKECVAIYGAGYTPIFNEFHSRKNSEIAIRHLREKRVEIDRAVAAAYGWTDVELEHDFHATKQGERYTISGAARRIILDRLLTLNNHRYDEELKVGLHENEIKAATKSTRKKSSSNLQVQQTLIPAEQRELF